MSSLGETLRRERQKRNLDLDTISHELKIAPRFLEAIEEERFDKLPAGVFAKSFVRQYASFLCLDADEMAAEVQRRMTPEPPDGVSGPHELRGSVLQTPLPRVEEWQRVGDRRGWSSSLPALGMVVLVMVVCSAVYAVWQRERRPAAAAPEAAPALATAQEPAPAAAQPAAQPAEPAAQPAPTEPTAQSAPKEQAGTEPPAPSAPATDAQAERHGTADAPPVNAATAPADTSGSANRTVAVAPAAGQVKLDIAAMEPVWVLARANGKYLFSGTLEANQTKTLQTDGTLLLRVGNAGGVAIIFNGKPLRDLGPKGQVRDIQFTPGGFQILAVPKPAPLPPPPPGEPR